jgi:hypothetical protein
MRSTNILRFFLAFGLWLTIFLGYASRLGAQTEGDSQYKERIAQAVREFDLGNWQEARALFKQAHQLKPNARTLRGMGMTAFEMRKYLWALRDLRDAIKETRQPLTDEQRAHAQKLIEQSKAFLGRFRLTVEPASAAVEIDEKPVELEADGAVLLEIGEHQLSARAPEYQETKQSITVEGGEDRELRISLEPIPAAAPVAPPPVAVTPPAPAAPPPQEKAAPVTAKQEPATASQSTQWNWPKKEKSGPTWAWATLGISALTGIGAGGFWLLSNKRFNDLKDKCDGFQCSTDAAESGKKEVQQLDKLTTIFLGVSVSFAALSVILFIVESVGGSDDSTAPAKSKANAELAPFGIGPSGLELKGRF